MPPNQEKPAEQKTVGCRSWACFRRRAARQGLQARLAGLRRVVGILVCKVVSKSHHQMTHFDSIARTRVREQLRSPQSQVASPTGWWSTPVLGWLQVCVCARGTAVDRGKEFGSSNVSDRGSSDAG